MRAVVVLLAAAVLLVGWVAIDAPAKRNTCDAPCTVTFPRGTQEDDWKIDYTHEGNVPVLNVTVGGM